MRYYQFKEDFKQGVGQPQMVYCIAAPCPSIYPEYITVFKKNDIVPGNPVGPEGSLAMVSGFLFTEVECEKDGKKYKVPASIVTQVESHDDIKQAAYLLKKNGVLIIIGIVGIALVLKTLKWIFG